MDNFMIEQTYRSDAAFNTDFTSSSGDFATLQPVSRQSTSSVSTGPLETTQDHPVADAEPHFLQEFGADIVNAARNEEVDEATFIRLTETQILRLKPEMTIRTQTKLMDKQMVLKKQRNGKTNNLATTSTNLSPSTLVPPSKSFLNEYTYDSVCILKGVIPNEIVEKLMNDDFDKTEFERLYRRQVVRYHCMALMDKVQHRFPNRDVPSPSNDDKRNLASHLTSVFPAIRVASTDGSSIEYGHLFHISPSQGGAIEYCIKNLKRVAKKRLGLLPPQKRQRTDMGAKEKTDDLPSTSTPPQQQGSQSEDKQLDTLNQAYDVTAEIRELIKETHKERREAIVKEKLCLESIIEKYPFLARKVEMVDAEFRLIVDEEVCDVDDRFTDTVMSVTNKKGDKMRDLITKLLTGQNAKHRDTLVNDKHPGILKASSHIELTQHNGIYYCKFPTDQTFPFDNERDMWLFYVKSCYVFNTMYKSSQHGIICLYIEHILGVPQTLRSPSSGAHKKNLALLCEPDSQ